MIRKTILGLVLALITTLTACDFSKSNKNGAINGETAIADKDNDSNVKKDEEVNPPVVDTNEETTKDKDEEVNPPVVDTNEETTKDYVPKPPIDKEEVINIGGSWKFDISTNHPICSKMHSEGNLYIVPEDNDNTIIHKVYVTTEMFKYDGNECSLTQADATFYLWTGLSSNYSMDRYKSDNDFFNISNTKLKDFKVIKFTDKEIIHEYLFKNNEKVTIRINRMSDDILIDNVPD